MAGRGPIITPMDVAQTAVDAAEAAAAIAVVKKLTDQHRKQTGREVGIVEKERQIQPEQFKEDPINKTRASALLAAREADVAQLKAVLDQLNGMGRHDPMRDQLAQQANTLFQTVQANSSTFDNMHATVTGQETRRTGGIILPGKQQEVVSSQTTSYDTTSQKLQEHVVVNQLNEQTQKTLVDQHVNPLNKNNN